MDQSSMDHYERQLYAVFTTFADSSGTLDRSALAELCAALQMETNGAGELAALAERPGERVPFSRFRDALLAVLGGSSGDSTRCKPAPDRPSDDESSGRELSPKLVYGSKKYGRRSRPHEASDLPPDVCDESGATDVRQFNLRRASSSPGDSQCVIRVELGRCTSFPGNQTAENGTKENHKLNNLHLEMDHNRIINCDEAVALCHSMKMGNVDEELLKQVFEEGDGDDCITVGEFFHRLNKKLINSITSETGEITVVPSGIRTGSEAGTVEREVVIDLWERAGVAHCRQMLHDLGFSGERITLVELSTALDEEIKSLLADVDKSAETNVPSLLLQASLSLHRYELRRIKDTMEQVFAENSKMKADLVEANQRAQVLAQEVDENHAKMESSLRNKVKQLEARHVELMREVGKGWAQEKEIMSTELAQLHARLSCLENEEVKQKTRCSSLERSNDDLEKRLATSQERTQELERVKIQLTKEVRALATERAELRAPGREHGGEVDRLAELVSDFRLENKSLRDRNDELCAEIDGLQEKLTREKRRLSLGRSKPQGGVDISSEQAVSLLEECEVWGGGGGAVKRRSDSPSKGHSPSEDESPRMGKLRRCHAGRDVELEVRSESGPDWELDSCSDGGSLVIDPGLLFMSHIESQCEKKTNPSNAETSRNKCFDETVVKNIKEALKSFPILETNNCESCNTLKGILSMIHQQLDNVNLATAKMSSEGISMSVDKSMETNATQTDEQGPSNNEVSLESLKADMESEKKTHDAEKLKLTNMCRDLESNLEQLKSEYDKCEEYWANKLSDEREIFNEEQKISDDKFQDLLAKISEYEEQFSPRQRSSGSGGALETIDEKYSLELQFTDLEEEFQRCQREKASELQEKEQEIILLKEQVKHLEQIKMNVLSDDIDVLNSNPEKVYDSKVSIVSNVEESLPQADSPIGYLWKQSTIQSPSKTDPVKRDTTRDYQNPAFARTSSQNENSEDNAKSVSDNERESSSLNPIKKPESPKRCNSAERLAEPSAEVETGGYNGWCGSGGVWAGGNMIQCAELEGQLRRNAQHSQEASGAARMALEQRCRQLQLALRQHQLYLDTVQQSARSENSLLRQKLYSAESAIGKLQQRLTSADLLVKELYVENCQLSARSPQLL